MTTTVVYEWTDGGGYASEGLAREVFNTLADNKCVPSELCNLPGKKYRLTLRVEITDDPDNN